MVPVTRTSKSYKRMRRSHHARTPANIVACPKCGGAKLPHHACERCGFVNRQLLVKLKKEEAA